MTSRLRIPHNPLSDAEWQALLPHILRRFRGRPCDHRARFDAIFRVAATDGPWSDLPEQYGKPDTVSRYFRRLTHEGLWEHLLLAPPPRPRATRCATSSAPSAAPPAAPSAFAACASSSSLDAST